MKVNINELVAALGKLANSDQNGQTELFELEFDNGQLEISAKLALDPLPDNVIPFPKQHE